MKKLLIAQGALRRPRRSTEDTTRRRRSSCTMEKDLRIQRKEEK